MGDKPGHKFRGNQWSGGAVRASHGGGSAGVSVRAPHDSATGVRNPDGTLKDERTAEAPQPGEEFVVYRLGREGSHELHGNAGNAEGVADHLIRTDEHLIQAGDTIHAFRVTVDEPMGGYEYINAGRGQGGQSAVVGRKTTFVLSNPDGTKNTTGRAGVVYSFGKDTKYKSRHVGSISVKAAEAKLKKKGLWDDVAGTGKRGSGGRTLGSGGTLGIADGIREVFRG